MARFYFHVRDRLNQLIDPDGVELPDLPTAVERAKLAVRDMLSHDMKIGIVDVGHRLDVENAQGAILYTLAFREAFKIVPG